MKEKRGKGKEQRRDHGRLKPRLLVWAEYQGKRVPLGDLSPTGAFIRTPTPLAVDAQLELHLVGRRLLEPIEVTAVVRRSEKGVGMGVEFTQFRGPGKVRLQVLLASVSVARILVIDDDEGIRRLLTYTLEREDYDVVTAADGLEGLQKALELEPDLIILDLSLPGLSGIELCERVRSTPSLEHVPVLILSGSADLAQFSTARRLGAMAFIHKPFQPHRLLTHVRMLLER